MLWVKNPRLTEVPGPSERPGPDPAWEGPGRPGSWRGEGLDARGSGGARGHPPGRTAHLGPGSPTLLGDRRHPAPWRRPAAPPRSRRRTGSRGAESRPAPRRAPGTAPGATAASQPAGTTRVSPLEPSAGYPEWVALANRGWGWAAPRGAAKGRGLGAWRAWRGRGGGRSGGRRRQSPELGSGAAVAAAEPGSLRRAPGRGGVNGPPGPRRAGTELPWDPRPRRPPPPVPLGHPPRAPAQPPLPAPRGCLLTTTLTPARIASQDPPVPEVEFLGRGP